MKNLGIQLSWVVVKDVKRAIQFFTEVVGLTLMEFDEKFGWAELRGKDGATLGIAQDGEFSPMPPGSNAIVTITVDDIEEAKEQMETKGAKMIGEIMEVPNEVKLQSFADQDGNQFQLVESLRKK